MLSVIINNCVNAIFNLYKQTERGWPPTFKGNNTWLSEIYNTKLRKKTLMFNLWCNIIQSAKSCISFYSVYLCMFVDRNMKQSMIYIDFR